MFKSLPTLTVVFVTMLMSTGCMNGVFTPPDGQSSRVSDIAAKASEVAAHVGGTDGFGGLLMDGYFDHMPNHISFETTEDLARDGSTMMVVIRNGADQRGIFHVSYIAGHMGPDEQMMDVVVGAGEEVTVEIPCSEIVGIGPLDEPGQAGCHLDDGQFVDNVMSVPGFLGGGGTSLVTAHTRAFLLRTSMILTATATPKNSSFSAMRWSCT